MRGKLRGNGAVIALIAGSSFDLKSSVMDHMFAVEGVRFHAGREQERLSSEEKLMLCV
jgi:hypothetical protein